MTCRSRSDETIGVGQKIRTAASSAPAMAAVAARPDFSARVRRWRRVCLLVMAANAGVMYRTEVLNEGGGHTLLRFTAQGAGQGDTIAGRE